MLDTGNRNDSCCEAFNFANLHIWCIILHIYNLKQLFILKPPNTLDALDPYPTQYPYYDYRGADAKAIPRKTIYIYIYLKCNLNKK